MGLAREVNRKWRSINADPIHFIVCCPCVFVCLSASGPPYYHLHHISHSYPILFFVFFFNQSFCHSLSVSTTPIFFIIPIFYFYHLSSPFPIRLIFSCISLFLPIRAVLYHIGDSIMTQSSPWAHHIPISWCFSEISSFTHHHHPLFCLPVSYFFHSFFLLSFHSDIDLQLYLYIYIYIQPYPIRAFHRYFECPSYLSSTLPLLAFSFFLRFLWHFHH